MKQSERAQNINNCGAVGDAANLEIARLNERVKVLEEQTERLKRAVRDAAFEIAALDTSVDGYICDAVADKRINQAMKSFAPPTKETSDDIR